MTLSGYGVTITAEITIGRLPITRATSSGSAPRVERSLRMITTAMATPSRTATPVTATMSARKPLAVSRTTATS